MPSVLRSLTWDDCEHAVRELADRIISLDRVREACGVFGPPRGGLVLAVCLSHRLGVPLLHNPTPGMIWVDDIVDSGRTLTTTSGLSAVSCAWFERRSGMVEVACNQCDGAEWVVFPWESMAVAERDRAAYELSRQ